MRQFLLILLLSILILSCGNDTKQEELELKEKELALKEKELNLRDKDSFKTIASVDTVKPTLQPLILTPLNINGDIGYVTFSQKGKTIFYFDAKSKRGKINLNGIEYVLNKIEGDYKLSGNNVTITTTQGKWEEMETDCAYGKSLVVTIKIGTQVLKLNNVDVQDCQSMVQ